MPIITIFIQHFKEVTKEYYNERIEMKKIKPAAIINRQLECI